MTQKLDEASLSYISIDVINMKTGCEFINTNCCVGNE